MLTNITQLVILVILSREDSYGLAILDRMKELMMAPPVSSKGSIYTILARMESQGLIVSQALSGPKGWNKLYRVTPLGRGALEEIALVIAQREGGEKSVSKPKGRK